MTLGKVYVFDCAYRLSVFHCFFFTCHRKKVFVRRVQCPGIFNSFRHKSPSKDWHNSILFYESQCHQVDLENKYVQFVSLSQINRSDCKGALSVSKVRRRCKERRRRCRKHRTSQQTCWHTNNQTVHKFQVLWTGTSLFALSFIPCLRKMDCHGDTMQNPAFSSGNFYWHGNLCAPCIHQRKCLVVPEWSDLVYLVQKKNMFFVTFPAGKAPRAFIAADPVMRELISGKAHFSQKTENKVHFENITTVSIRQTQCFVARLTSLQQKKECSNSCMKLQYSVVYTRTTGS